MQNASINNTTIISDNIPGQVSQLKEAAGKNILIFGSPTAANSLMAANLIDDYWLFVNPILLGKGLPLFQHTAENIKLKLVESITFNSGVVCLHHEKANSK